MTAKHRIGIFFIVLLVFINLIICEYSHSLRNVIQNKLQYAVIYYQQQVKHYYLRFRGIIPPPVVAQNSNEWERFSLICDSLVLNQRDSLSIFKVYIDLLHNNKGFIVNMDNQNKTNRKTISSRRNRDLFNWRMENEKKRILNLKNMLAGRFSENELENFDMLLSHWWILPDVELRALRDVKLLPEQRKLLVPIATQLVKALQHVDFFMRPRFDNEMIIYEQQEEKDNKLIKEEFIALVNKVLNDKQIDQWKLKQQKVQMELNQFLSRIEHIKSRSNHYTEINNTGGNEEREMS